MNYGDIGWNSRQACKQSYVSGSHSFIEMDYNRKEMAKDVSVVVWGDKGKVCLEHKGGLETDSFVTI